jgi:hypothetical protein
MWYVVCMLLAAGLIQTQHQEHNNKPMCPAAQHTIAMASWQAAAAAY